MGFRSGVNLFYPMIRDLLKTSLSAHQWGLFLLYVIFFLLFGIIQLICLIFTGKTVSTSFKHYAKKNRVKAKIAADMLAKALDDTKEHFFKRLGEE